MDKLQELVAIEEIKQVKAKYWRLIDTKDFDQLNTVFTDDAVFDSVEATYDPVLGQMPGTQPAEIWETRQGIVEGVKQSMPPEMQSVHMGHIPEVTILAENKATGIFPFNDRIKIPNGLSFNGFGYYHEEYEKDDTGWKIKRSIIKRLRVVFDE
ncbi:nuclear transport factor 2 family protein [Enterococcus sp. AZ109]|uniref:nuclear transport factor 2 family protein n=1 Tax=Enterococcus sp. AZ109 TaxID=2774634 RepID=UPI003F299F6E